MNENLSQKAYWHIHDKLTSGDLRPGHRLSNRTVAKEIGASFTPVREALNRLVSEGLLEYREGLGVLVPRATRQEIKDLYEVREMLECAVASRFAGQLPADTLREMRDVHERMGQIVEKARPTGHMDEHGTEFRQLDTAFHLAFIRGTGNRQLLDTLSDLKKKCAIKSGVTSSMTELIGHVFRAEPFESVQRTQRQHAELIELLEAGDGEQAAQLMRQHISAGRQLALEAMDRAHMNLPRRSARAVSSAVDEEEV